MTGRPSWVSFIPPEWNEREKKGLCPVCGTPKVAFDPGMKKFCSEKCRKAYGEKLVFWGELRERVKRRDNYTCRMCGINNEKLEAEFRQRWKEWNAENKRYVLDQKEFLEEFKREVEERIQRQLDSILEDVELISSPESIADYVIQHPFGFNSLRLPHPYDGEHPPKVTLEVDHITAIANGGDMWDENNLQTLCSRCHAKKTRADMRLLRAGGRKQATLPTTEEAEASG